MYMARVLTPSQAMVATSAHCVGIQATWPVNAPETESESILYKHVTPYNPEAWHLALLSSGLIDSFPNLVHDLVHGAPIGNLPPLSYTFIPNNLASANINPDYMYYFLAKEITSSCMDGPYSIDMAHQIFKGHFWTAPLGLVEKPSSGALHLIRHHSKEDQLGLPTNGWIDTSSGATKFYSAAHAANFVSVVSTLAYSPPAITYQHHALFTRRSFTTVPLVH